MIGTIIVFIIVGLVVGALARLVVPGRNPIGLLMTILLGIVGAIAGGLIANAIGAGFIIQLILAIAVAAILVYFISGAHPPQRASRLTGASSTPPGRAQPCARHGVA